MYKMDEMIGKYSIKQIKEMFNKYAGDKGALDEESLHLLIKEKLIYNIIKQICLGIKEIHI